MVLAASGIPIECYREMKNKQHSHRHQLGKRLPTWLLVSYYTIMRLNLGNTMEDMKEVDVAPHNYELESKLNPFHTFCKMLKNQRWKRTSDMIWLKQDLPLKSSYQYIMIKKDK